MHFRDAIPNVVTLPQHFKKNRYFVQGMGKIFHPGYDDETSWSTPWKTPKAETYANLKTAEVKDEDAAPKNKTKGGPALESGNVADNFYKDGMVADMVVGPRYPSGAVVPPPLRSGSE